MLLPALCAALALACLLLALALRAARDDRAAALLTLRYARRELAALHARVAARVAHRPPPGSP